jgi:hypothetical protein
LRAIVDGRGEEARRAAAILASEFGQVRRARLLRFVDGIHRLLPPLRHVSSLGLKLRRRWQKRRTKPAIRRQAERFREYEGYMNL